MAVKHNFSYSHFYKSEKYYYFAFEKVNPQPRRRLGLRNFVCMYEQKLLFLHQLCFDQFRHVAVVQPADHRH